MDLQRNRLVTMAIAMATMTMTTMAGCGADDAPAASTEGSEGPANSSSSGAADATTSEDLGTTDPGTTGTTVGSSEGAASPDTGATDEGSTGETSPHTYEFTDGLSVAAAFNAVEFFMIASSLPTYAYLYSVVMERPCPAFEQIDGAWSADAGTRPGCRNDDDPFEFRGDVHVNGNTSIQNGWGWQMYEDDVPSGWSVYATGTLETANSEAGSDASADWDTAMLRVVAEGPWIPHDYNTNFPRHYPAYEPIDYEFRDYEKHRSGTIDAEGYWRAYSDEHAGVIEIAGRGSYSIEGTPTRDVVECYFSVYSGGTVVLRGANTVTIDFDDACVGPTDLDGETPCYAWSIEGGESGHNCWDGPRALLPVSSGF